MMPRNSVSSLFDRDDQCPEEHHGGRQARQNMEFWTPVRLESAGGAIKSR